MTEATEALDRLERVVPSGRKPKKRKTQQAGFQWRDTGEGERGPEVRDDQGVEQEEEDESTGNAVVELEGDDEEAAQKLEALKLDDERKEQVTNLRAKSLLRRAKANVEQGGWGDLTSAEEGTVLPSWRLPTTVY